MNTWMEEFRQDRMNDYAASNPCLETLMAQNADLTCAERRTAFWNKIVSAMTSIFSK